MGTETESDTGTGAPADEPGEIPPPSEVRVPPLPHGGAVELPGRGTTFARHISGPPGAPVVLLLHGWTANADLNFFTCYRPLGEHFRVLAIDHRGHGRGIRTRTGFRLEDCADDAAALCALLGIERVIPIGYSMGGTIAQLLWRRHPQLVQGLVLGATSAYFRTSRQERLGFIGLGGLARIARLTPQQARSWALHQFYLKGKAATWEPWAVEQVAQHDWRMVLEAGRAIGAYDARPWIAEVDVPASTIVTMRDEVVPVRRQIRLFQAIKDCEAFRIDGNHDAILAKPEFPHLLVRSIDSVAQRT